MRDTLQRWLWVGLPLLGMAWWSAPDWPARSQTVAEPWRDMVVHAAEQWSQWGRQLPHANGVAAPEMPAPTPSALPEVVQETSVTTPLEVPAPLAGGVVLTVGDSLMNGVAQALQAQLGPKWTVIDEARHSTGLSVPAYFDWPAHLQEQVRQHNPDLVLIHLGGNDGQAIRDGQAWHRVGSEEWTILYQARVQDLVAAARTDAPARPVLWLGLPPMRSSDFANKAAALTPPQRDGAIQAGAVWVDGWAAWPEGYAHDGLDETGRHRVWRADDGIHYARAGSARQAYSVWSAAVQQHWVAAP